MRAFIPAGVLIGFGFLFGFSKYLAGTENSSWVSLHIVTVRKLQDFKVLLSNFIDMILGLLWAECKFKNFKWYFIVF